MQTDESECCQIWEKHVVASQFLNSYCRNCFVFYILHEVTKADGAVLSRKRGSSCSGLHSTFFNLSFKSINILNLKHNLTSN